MFAVAYRVVGRVLSAEPELSRRRLLYIQFLRGGLAEWNPLLFAALSAPEK